MAIKLDYIARETSANLWRNVTLTLAAILTVAVSLTMAGSALLIRESVNNATARWKGGVEFIIFMEPTATAEQEQEVERVIEDSPDIRSFDYFDKQEAYEEFLQLFRNDPTMTEGGVVTPEILPTSFRVVPAEANAEVIAALASQFETEPGVREVVAPFETVRTLQRMSSWVGNIILGAAVILLGASILLILNTIRTAVFARRREIEVMKLVGATNWFIRIPFMLEGLIQSVLGAAFAVFGVVSVKVLLIDRIVGQGEQDKILADFAVTSGEVSAVVMLIVAIGAIVGVIGSGIAVSRFLDV